MMMVLTEGPVSLIFFFFSFLPPLFCLYDLDTETGVLHGIRLKGRMVGCSSSASLTVFQPFDLLFDNGEVVGDNNWTFLPLRSLFLPLRLPIIFPSLGSTFYEFEKSWVRHSPPFPE